MANSKNFKSSELACSCCNSEQVQQWALDKLQTVRDAVNRPLSITSAYRCSKHPVEAKKIESGKKPGTHNQGLAFDVYVSNGLERAEIVIAGLSSGATGIGVDKNFIHLDWRDSDPVMWVYK